MRQINTRNPEVRADLRLSVEILHIEAKMKQLTKKFPFQTALRVDATAMLDQLAIERDRLVAQQHRERLAVAAR